MLNVGLPQERPSPPGNPWIFVPALYFLEGIPLFIVSTVSVTMFKKMGVSNSEIGLWTSLITWPWVVKMLWGPLVEAKSTKRKWVIGTQVAAIAMMFAESMTITQGNFLFPTLVILTALAFLSATHDIAADGFYIIALGQTDQAFYVGIRSTAYRLANIFCNGFLVYLAGKFETEGLHLKIGGMPIDIPGTTIPGAWQRVLWVGLAVYAFFVILGILFMPNPEEKKGPSPNFPFERAFQEYFTQKKVAVILGFILFYRFGESMVSKMSTPFLLDPIEKGGLGIPTEQLGYILGGVGVVALVAGGIIGGMVISRYGIKKCLWPMVLAMNIPNLLYIWAAVTPSGKDWVTMIVAVDQFGYGFGFAAYMVFLMFITQGTSFPTAHYAISTGLQALGAMGAGIVSGYIQEAFGYAGFFAGTLVLAVPGMALLPFLPLDKEDLKIAPVDVD